MAKVKKVYWGQLTSFLQSTGIFDWNEPEMERMVWKVPKLFNIYLEHVDDSKNHDTFCRCQKVHIWAAHGIEGRELRVKTYNRRRSLPVSLPDVLKIIREVFDEAVLRLEKDAWTVFNMGWDDALVFESDLDDESDPKDLLPGCSSSNDTGKNSDDDDSHEFLSGEEINIS